ncbi:unnamed protein product [Lampetra planeri]
MNSRSGDREKKGGEAEEDSGRDGGSETTWQSSEVTTRHEQLGKGRNEKNAVCERARAAPAHVPCVPCMPSVPCVRTSCPPCPACPACPACGHRALRALRARVLKRNGAIAV